VRHGENPSALWKSRPVAHRWSDLLGEREWEQDHDRGIIHAEGVLGLLVVDEDTATSSSTLQACALLFHHPCPRQR
jgi:hypothetical protein